MLSDFYLLGDSLGKFLQKKSWRLAVVESCTGGLLSAAITAIPGSSAYFDRGFVTYSNESKIELLGVSKESLSKEGAVSEKVVREMVMGTLAHSHADIALAITGIAGPMGGTKEKPVGTVWFAKAVREGEVVTIQQEFSGDRAQIQKAAALFALEWLSS